MNLHSTMYLLNRRMKVAKDAGLYNLHSTMYLLNRVAMTRLWTIYLNLHSTMYLLNLKWHTLTALTHLQFTFHHVSIKSSLPFLSLKPVHIYIPLCIY